MQRIVLTGFMGSGKSTVGRLLAARLGWCFSDLDEAIEARLCLSVPQIFRLHGEAAFREAEVEDLRTLLNTGERVIALGGGAPATAAIRHLLSSSPNTSVVHLRAPFSILYERCRLQATDPAATGRPLLGEEEAAALRFRERLPLYASVAHVEVNAAAGTAAEVASAILHRLAGQGAR